MAKSNLQVMLTKNVTKLGKLGDLVSVAPGYAQNFLIPQGMAIRATTGVVREVGKDYLIGIPASFVNKVKREPSLKDYYNC